MSARSQFGHTHLAMQTDPHMFYSCHMKTRFFRHAVGAGLALALSLTACAQPGVTPAAKVTESAQGAQGAADLAAVKEYLRSRTALLKTSTGALQATSDQYHALAKSAGFDYAALYARDKDAVIKLITTARNQWVAASPQYEQMEGIVAGVPALADYDVTLDAGASAAEGGDGVVGFDITLPDGAKLEKPGNLFGVTESALWGTFAAYSAKGVFDFDGDGAVEFGESLPDANVLKGSIDMLHEVAGQLDSAAGAWQPTDTDAFQSLVTMIPTMNEYFDSWKNSRFVSGSASQQRDFVAISRLADMIDILGGLEVVYKGVSPLVSAKNAGEDSAISGGLTGLRAFVGDVYARENAGKHFTPEEADMLGKEAQDRATALTGKIAQMAATLNVNVSK